MPPISLGMGLSPVMRYRAAGTGYPGEYFPSTTTDDGTIAIDGFQIPTFVASQVVPQGTSPPSSPTSGSDGATLLYLGYIDFPNITDPAAFGTVAAVTLRLFSQIPTAGQTSYLVGWKAPLPVPFTPPVDNDNVVDSTYLGFSNGAATYTTANIALTSVSFPGGANSNLDVKPIFDEIVAASGWAYPGRIRFLLAPVYTTSDPAWNISCRAVDQTGTGTDPRLTITVT